MELNPGLLVECGEHKKVPYSFVCRHLIEGQSRIWRCVTVHPPREVDADWVCPSCKERYEHHCQTLADDIKVVCMFCVRQLRQNYKPDAIDDPEDFPPENFDDAEMV